MFIERYSLANRRIVQPPQTRAMRRFGQIRRAERALEQQTGEQADAADIAARVHLRAAQVQEAREVAGRRDVPVRCPGLAGWEPHDEVPTPEEQVEAREGDAMNAGLVRVALSTLDARERVIIESRAFRHDSITLEVLSKRLCLSRERVRQLEARALGKMRAELLRCPANERVAARDTARISRG